MRLWLPFAYEHRCKLRRLGERAYQLRGEIPVDVPECSHADLMDLSSVLGTAWKGLGSYQGRLFRCAHGSAPIAAVDFEKLVRGTVAYDLSLDRVAWNAGDFPILPYMHEWPYDHRNPLRFNSALLPYEAISMQRVLKDDRDARGQEASSFYRDAFLIVDGEVWMTAREPVWQIFPGVNNEPGSVSLEMRPEFKPWLQFSLPRWRDANEFANAVGVNLGPDKASPIAECLDGLFLRSDTDELTTALRQLIEAKMKNWPPPASVASMDLRSHTLLADVFAMLDSDLDEWLMGKVPAFDYEVMRRRSLFEPAPVDQDPSLSDLSVEF
ncbi:hypothetical protein LJR009_002884 [Bosea sp. LjRoot9]|uniref:hypothetical protein n=1 Tax=Bosea sp. LjRoot9 TaxID=3342341 RepID=UPI003ED08834